MTTPKKLIRRKQSLLDLAEYLQNISQACKIHGVSRQHFYDIRKAHEEHGLEGLREKSRRKPCLKNRVGDLDQSFIWNLRKIRLFVLPAKSPKLNGAVERVHKTHTKEFHEVYECSWNVTELKKELMRWKHIYTK